MRSTAAQPTDTLAFDICQLNSARIACTRHGVLKRAHYYLLGVMLYGRL